jgi:phospholipid transport system transporter-binding protein
MQLPATATLQEASALVRSVEVALAADPGPLVIDASALRSLDTSTIAVLLQARRLAQASGRAFSVNGAPAQLAQLAQLYGVEPLLALAPAAADPAPASAPGAVSTPV